ncbi:DUF1360 domain-containing protein [Streptomyces sp. NRRL S-337]|uniref:DUF1360 domain-containing protein n=1 Tax=Streptomyces sp. NRRL S-337 TaxID=1463900 RepID=UPI00099D8605|nr:DUF1360 domain-containing protein [Streptomyces sp. NRRL S-337]
MGRRTHRRDERRRALPDPWPPDARPPDAQPPDSRPSDAQPPESPPPGDARQPGGHDYSPEADRPLRGYLTTLAAFGAYNAGWALAIRRRGRSLPERPDPRDLALTAVATFRLSRLLTKGSVTSPLRAPFTVYEGPEGPAEVSEHPRKGGPTETLGELLTCPFCLSVWLASTLTAAQLLWPRLTRTTTGALTALAAADTLQLAYTALESRAAHPEPPPS